MNTKIKHLNIFPFDDAFDTTELGPQHLNVDVADHENYN
jgi:hypothetical protein